MLQQEMTKYQQTIHSSHAFDKSLRAKQETSRSEERPLLVFLVEHKHQSFFPVHQPFLSFPSLFEGK